MRYEYLIRCLNIHGYIECLNMHGYIACLSMHSYIGCLSIHETYVTANNSTNDNAEFFFVSDLKIVYYNNY